MICDKTPVSVFGHAFARANRCRLLSLIALTLSAFGVPAARADWPEFRGPWGDGHASAPGDTKPLGLPLHWSETNNVKWKTEIPYRGWSTPVVLGGQVWLTTATIDGHDFFAIGLDAETGAIRFNEKVFHSDNPEPLGNGASMNCLRHAFAGDRAGPGLCPLRQLWHGLPGHQHRQGALETGRPALPSLPRPVFVADHLREPADPDHGRRRPAISRRPGQEDRQDRLEDQSLRRLERRECARARWRATGTCAKPTARR